jgi:SPX domain protein involved in polyphosphate accumulation
MGKLAAAFTIMIVLSLCWGTASATDLTEGFMGMEWGADIRAQDGLTKLYAKKEVAYYINPEEVHTINGREIPDVVYGFFQDKFFAVYIRVDTIEAFGDIKKNMKTKYGPPDTSTSLKTGQTVYKWKHKNVKIKMKIIMKEDKMKVGIYYKPISNKLNEAEIAALETFHDKSYRFFPIDKNKKPKMMPILEF